MGLAYFWRVCLEAKKEGSLALKKEKICQSGKLAPNEKVCNVR